MYILDQEKKRKFFRQMVVCPSVRPCAKVMYTKTQERVEIIECGFFCLKGDSNFFYFKGMDQKITPKPTGVMYNPNMNSNFISEVGAE